MKKADIKVGGHYRAKVNGVLTTVRVDRIETVNRSTAFRKAKDETRYHVTNLHTGRTTTFRSAAKFRSAATEHDSRQTRLNAAVKESLEERSSKQQADDDQAAFMDHSDALEVKTRELEGEQRPDPTYVPAGAEQNSLNGTPIAVSVLPTTSPTTTPNLTAGFNETANGRHFTAPADLKGDQARAFEVVVGRIDRGERVTKLCGYAGTGKTYMLGAIVLWARANNYEVTVVAPTHKAKGVIETKLEDRGVPVGEGEGSVQVRTIHSLLGLMLAPDFENDTGGRVLVADANAKTKLRPGLVICDEASMVGSVLKEHIDASPRHVRWLFVGDLAQLPPVGEGVSELLDDPDASLEEVLRQAKGSEILNLATRIRSGDMDLEYEPGRDVTHVDDAEALFQKARERFDKEEYRKDPSHARVLVFRNARRTSINLRMRQLLVGAEEPYVPGEWLVMYAAFSPEKSRLNVLCEAARKTIKGTRESGRAWGKFFDAKRAIDGAATPGLHVSQEVKVVAVEDRELSIGEWTFAVHQLTVEDRDGGFHDLPVLRADQVQRHQQVMTEQAAKAQDLRKQRDEQTQGSYRWVELDGQRKRAWGVYFSLEETFAQVDYAYAMTVHKSQGSTFDHAFVDVPDLMSSGGMQQRILYTAVTRPAKSLTFYA